MQHSESFFQNTACPYFPCHAGADKDTFNCMFCYCPLYALGDKCGGNFRYLENGIKDCSACLISHRPDARDVITARFPEIVALAKKRDA